MTHRQAFRSRLRAREPIIGTFLKTASPTVCEVLSLTSLGCVCVDAEHAPFGRTELDACLMALAAGDMPALVRVPSAASSEILYALDGGGVGVVVPHVVSGDQAREVVAACHYGAGGRGYAGSTRAARFTTTPMAAHLADSAAMTTVIAQIEDAEALPHLDAIARTPGLDALFVGRMDLTVSLGASSPQEPVVVAAVEQIVAAGCAAGIAVGLFLTTVNEAQDWLKRGATFFLVASDQQLLLEAVRASSERFAAFPRHP
ncbi:MAG: aldolase/citrate lyase family protein [Vicinamibacterales bacterium]